MSKGHRISPSRSKEWFILVLGLGGRSILVWMKLGRYTVNYRVALWVEVLGSITLNFEPKIIAFSAAKRFLCKPKHSSKLKLSFYEDPKEIRCSLG